MTYSTPEGRPRGGSRPQGSSSRQYSGGSSRPLVSGQGSYHGPRGTRGRSGSGRRGRGAGLKGGSGRGGYPLRSRSINFAGQRNGIFGADRRLLILGALAVIVLIMVVVGVSSCVSSCSPQPQSSASDDANQVDSRVAAGVSEELTLEFSEALNRGEKLQQIAANANSYEDQALLELALKHPEAIDFVAAYPTAEKTAQPYGETASQGAAPQLFCWDSRWGNVTYAGRALALTGSGPTSLAMALIGLTGETEQGPAELAAAATEQGMATGDSSMSAAFLEASAEDLGIEVTSFASNADNLKQYLDAGTYVLLEAGAGTLTEDAHWVVLITENGDGTIVVYDPTSPEVSAHPWSAETLAASAETLYAVTLPSSEDGSTSTTN